MRSGILTCCLLLSSGQYVRPVHSRPVRWAEAQFGSCPGADKVVGFWENTRSFQFMEVRSDGSAYLPRLNDGTPSDFWRLDVQIESKGCFLVMRYALEHHKVLNHIPDAAYVGSRVGLMHDDQSYTFVGFGELPALGRPYPVSILWNAERVASGLDVQMSGIHSCTSPTYSDRKDKNGFVEVEGVLECPFLYANDVNMEGMPNFTQTLGARPPTPGQPRRRCKPMKGLWYSQPIVALATYPASPDVSLYAFGGIATINIMEQWDPAGGDSFDDGCSFSGTARWGDKVGADALAASFSADGYGIEMITGSPKLWTQGLQSYTSGYVDEKGVLHIQHSDITSDLDPSNDATEIVPARVFDAEFHRGQAESGEVTDCGVPLGKAGTVWHSEAFPLIVYTPAASPRVGAETDVIADLLSEGEINATIYSGQRMTLRVQELYGNCSFTAFLEWNADGIESTPDSNAWTHFALGGNPSNDGGSDIRIMGVVHHEDGQHASDQFHAIEVSDFHSHSALIEGYIREGENELHLHWAGTTKDPTGQVAIFDAKLTHCPAGCKFVGSSQDRRLLFSAGPDPEESACAAHTGCAAI